MTKRTDTLILGAYVVPYLTPAGAKSLGAYGGYETFINKLTEYHQNNMIINECDLVISIGARLGIRQVGRAPQCFAPKADLVRCDIDEYELSRNIKEGEKKYHTDAKDFVRMLMTENVGDYTKWKLE